MNTYRYILPIILVSLLSSFTGCRKNQPATLEEVLLLYRENKLEQALPLFEQLVAQDTNNAEKCVWLAETYRRLGKKEEALKKARLALILNPKSSFAHTVIAEVSNPVMGEWSQANSDTTWFHLMKAIECDSTDGHPWLLIFGESMHRGKPEMVRRSLRSLVEAGFLTKAALAYGRWMLRALPEDAILLTNGDMDTYPPCAVQEVEGFRKDVVIVNRGTLETKWHARFIRDYKRVKLPVDDTWLEQFEVHRDSQGNLVTLSDEIFRKWIEQKSKGFFDRPIAVAVTVDELYWSKFKNNMRFAGAFLQWQDTAAAKIIDTTSMLKSLEGVSPDSFSGPWVSERDRSPIRRMYTKNLVRNVTEVAIMCSEMLLRSKRISDANHWVQWADELERNTELGPVFSERIAQLKENIFKAQR